MTCDFLGVRSYGDATVSSGVVEITSDLAAPIAGKHVLLVEDIADTGLTLRYLLDLLHARGPASVHTCVLLSKTAAAHDVDPGRFRRFRGPRRLRGRLRAGRRADLPESAVYRRAGRRQGRWPESPQRGAHVFLLCSSCAATRCLIEL